MAPQRFFVPGSGSAGVAVGLLIAWLMPARLTSSWADRHEFFLGEWFRQRRLARERLIGFWTCMSSYIAAELVGLADVDAPVLDAEHSANEVPMQHQLQASNSAARPAELE